MSETSKPKVTKGKPSSKDFPGYTSSKDFESIASLTDFALDSGSRDFHPAYSTTEIEKEADHSGVSVEILRATHRLMSSKAEKAQTVLFVSTSVQEGKSLIMNHIAYASAGVFGKKVLLIDLQESRELYSLERSVDGLPEDFFSLHSTDYFNLQRMVLNLPKSRMYKFLQENLPKFSEQYDLILVEAPALYAPTAPDPIVLSTLFQEIVVIFRPTQTPSANIQETITLLRQAGVAKPLLFLNNSHFEPTNLSWFQKLVKRIQQVVKMFRRARKA